MKVYFGQFRKRVNSTKPALLKNFVWRGEGVLKGECDVTAPVISVIWGNNLFSPARINYAWLPDFERYYFVTNIVYNANRVEFHMSCDVLASYRDEILKSTQYVLRSASAGNLDIVDNLYPATAQITTGVSSLDVWTNTALNSGYYVLGIVNDATDAVGGLSYYVMTNAQFAGLRSALMTNYQYMRIDKTEISEELQRAIINPFQYIASCRWFPFQPPTNGVTSSISICGWTMTGGTAYKLAAGAFWGLDISIGVPVHPQSGRGRWLQLNPYSEYSLFIAPFGVIPIDPAKLKGAASITCRIKVDCVSGVGTIEVYAGSASTTPLLYWADCQIGVDIQLSQVSYIGNAAATVNNLAGSAISAMTGNIGGGIAGFLGETTKIAGAAALGAMTQSETSGGTFSGIGTALAASMGQLSVQGANGSIAAFSTQGQFSWKFTSVVNNDNEDLGTPCCQKRLLSGLSGFTTVQSPDLDSVPATAPEINLIRQHMSSGFFIEEADPAEEGG